MARNEQTEYDFEPRHRILGAIVLVSLGFIVFSIVLNEQPQQLSPEDKQVGVTPDTRVVVTPVPSPQAQPDTKPMVSIKPVPKVIDNPLAPKPEPEPGAKSPAPKAVETVTNAEPAITTTLKPKSTSKSSGGRWTVQVGTFADPANARRLSKKLEQQKYQVTLKVVALKQGRAVRVRVGPFDSRASATRARDIIRKNNGINGVVLALN
jgi:DedD protein